MEVDTFTMPMTDEIVEKGLDATQDVVIRAEDRLNSGILIKLIRTKS